MRKIKLLPTIVVKYMLRSFFGIIVFTCKVNPKKVTLASYRSNTVKDNLSYIYKGICDQYPDFECHFLMRKLKGTFLGKVTYLFHLVRSSYHLATSRYFIIDDYYFPVYVLNPRKETEIIQLWHGAGAFKKFGLSTLGKPYGPSEFYLKHVDIHGNYQKAFVSSSEVVPFFAEAFNMSKESIYPLGIPRTDYFYKSNEMRNIRSSFREKYPSLNGKKLILYAPTFRGKSHDQTGFELPFDIEKMAMELEKTHALIIHLHPYMDSNLKIENQRFAYHINDTYTIQELLLLSDMLITDYSTVFFEYSLLERPMIFYPYDLEEYKADRDFYYDYEALIPGPKVTDTESLVRVIQQESFDMEYIKAFKNRFFDYQDGEATKRIVKTIFENEN